MAQPSTSPGKEGPIIQVWSPPLNSPPSFSIVKIQHKKRANALQASPLLISALVEESDFIGGKMAYYNEVVERFFSISEQLKLTHPMKLQPSKASV
jgi:hypothetical protein